MPYITPDERSELVTPYFKMESTGQLNYLITCLLVDYMDQRPNNYQTMNDMIGVLECAKQELYRRKVAPYEDKKIDQNGDVF